MHVDYDSWKLAGPMEADEQKIDFACEAVDDDDIPCPFDGPVIAQICGDRMTWQCPVCGTDEETSARDWFFDD